MKEVSMYIMPKDFDWTGWFKHDTDEDLLAEYEVRIGTATAYKILHEGEEHVVQKVFCEAVAAELARRKEERENTYRPSEPGVDSGTEKTPDQDS